MSAIRAIGRPATCAGFALAGIPVREASTPREASAAIEAIASQPDIGVVLVEQELFERLDEAQRQKLQKRPTPIIVPFPGPAWEEQASPAEAYVLELLRRAIGYRVRLR